jgi:hypothetical protein
VSTSVPGTIEKALTAWLNLVEFAGSRPISLASAGSSTVEPFIGALATQRSTRLPCASNPVESQSPEGGGFAMAW